MYGLAVMLSVPIWTTSKNIDKINERQIPRGTHLADKSRDKIVKPTRF